MKHSDEGVRRMKGASQTNLILSLSFSLRLKHKCICSVILGPLGLPSNRQVASENHSDSFQKLWVVRCSANHVFLRGTLQQTNGFFELRTVRCVQILVLVDTQEAAGKEAHTNTLNAILS